MIDLHCHILPAIDDGARDMADSVAMARQAEADGIEVVCATPHIRHDHDVRIEELALRVRKLNNELHRRGVGVRVATGGEVAETVAGHLNGRELEQVSLGGAGRWILLEPAPGPLSDSLEEAVELLARRGYRSLIAHPERHPGPDLAERLAGLIARGVLVQATAAHLERGESAAGMVELASRGLVHVLGSDSHSAAYGRPVRLSGGLAALRGVGALAPHLNWIGTRAPAAILHGEELEPPFEPLGARSRDGEP